MNGKKFIKHSSVCLKQFNQKYSTLSYKSPRNRLLKTHHHALNGHRNIAFVFRALRGALKVRYIILGSAVGGGVQLSKVIH